MEYLGLKDANKLMDLSLKSLSLELRNKDSFEFNSDLYEKCFLDAVKNSGVNEEKFFFLFNQDNASLDESNACTISKMFWKAILLSEHREYLIRSQYALQGIQFQEKIEYFRKKAKGIN